MLDRLFRLLANGTTVRTEIIAGITTFMTLAYIIAVNPFILSAAGMNKGAVAPATCIVSGIITIFKGLIANYPIALALGTGIKPFGANACDVTPVTHVSTGLFPLFFIISPVYK